MVCSRGSAPTFGDRSPVSHPPAPGHVTSWQTWCLHASKGSKTYFNAVLQVVGYTKYVVVGLNYPD